MTAGFIENDGGVHGVFVSGVVFPGEGRHNQESNLFVQENGIIPGQ